MTIPLNGGAAVASYSSREVIDGALVYSTRDLQVTSLDPIVLNGKWNPQCIHYDSSENLGFWFRIEYMGKEGEPKPTVPLSQKKTSIFPRVAKKKSAKKVAKNKIAKGKKKPR